MSLGRVPPVKTQLGKGKFSMMCKNTTSCTVHEDTVDLYFKGISLDGCNFGECAPVG